jgi:23S rRNA (cytosine1962-C5)-methyltransferase
MSIHTPARFSAYELIDSGNGMRLERFGKYLLSRPDPEALWLPHLSDEEWGKADAIYVRKAISGSWKYKSQFPKSWTIEYGGLSFELRPTSFKHVGLFPEQEAHWAWLAEKITSRAVHKNVPPKVLNLFAYTGGASLAAARAGAHVVHVDSSKVAIEWARKNAELSGLAGAPIRWIEDDVLGFLRREVRRGSTYDAIIMDPPAFGHGSGTKLWKIERDFYELMQLATALLSPEPLAFVVNGYTAGYSPLTLANNLLPLKERFGGTLESGELALAEKNTERLLPAGVFARWSC